MNTIATYSHQPWNKGKLVGQKAPLRPRDIWAIRVRLQIAEKVRDLALFDLAMRKKGTEEKEEKGDRFICWPPSASGREQPVA